MKAYFTVEAAFLFPMVAAVYVALFYMGFYQYDRCVAEQSLRLSLLQGSRAGGNTEQEISTAYSANSRDKYIIAQVGDVELQVSSGKITGILEGTMGLSGLSFTEYGRNGEWKFAVTGESREWDPVFWLRTWKRLKKEDENGESDQSEPPVSESGGGTGE